MVGRRRRSGEPQAALGKKRLTVPDHCPKYGLSRPRRGASGGVRKRGGIGARSGPARVSDIAAVASAGEQPAAVDAAPSPPSQGGVSGSSASRSPARNMGAPPGILAAASPVPAKSRVRADALKAPKPRLVRGRLAPKRGARDQKRRAGGLVRLGIRAEPYPPIPPSCARPPGRAARTRPPAPLGGSRMLLDHPLGPRRPRGQRRMAPVRRSGSRSRRCRRSRSGPCRRISGTSAG